MVWLYPSPVSVGRGRSFSLAQIDSTCLRGGNRRGRGDTHLDASSKKIFRFESILFSVLYNRDTSLLTLQFPAITLKSIKF
jgi:hypothetical protein